VYVIAEVLTTWKVYHSFELILHLIARCIGWLTVMCYLQTKNALRWSAQECEQISQYYVCQYRAKVIAVTKPQLYFPVADC